ncbi:MAG: DUF4111 domain-containing protein [Anaerolineae bacterium]|nr:DUF4111 domain-containing protein [Anaerolineae bacterium]
MADAAKSSDIGLVGHIIDRLIDELNQILKDDLVGIYLYGSLISGDFDIAISDIDLVVVLRAELDQPQFLQLQRMHTRVVNDHPAWRDRLELAYISGRALKTFRVAKSTIGIISPGEPFHLIEAGDDWLISWYDLRRNGVALQGPSIQSLIDSIPTPDWLDAVREHICAYRRTVRDAADIMFLSYIVLTVARGAYTLAHGQAASKVKTAAWAQHQFPQWSDLIARALKWRLGATEDAPPLEQARPEVASYVDDILSRGICQDAGLSAE